MSQTNKNKKNTVNKSSEMENVEVQDEKTTEEPNNVGEDNK